MRTHFSLPVMLGVGAVVTSAIAVGATLTILRRETKIGVPMYRPVVAQPASDFTLEDIEGTRHSLADLRGQYVLIHFFCGCSPCRELTRAWCSLQQQKRGMAILGVTGMSSADAQSYAQGENVNFPVLLDPYLSVSRQWNSVMCPRCWLIAPNGKIVYGSSSDASVPQILKSVQQHLISPSEANS
jgi:peroxiredoxin